MLGGRVRDELKRTRHGWKVNSSLLAQEEMLVQGPGYIAWAAPWI